MTLEETERELRRILDEHERRSRHLSGDAEMSPWQLATSLRDEFDRLERDLRQLLRDMEDTRHRMVG